MTNDRSRLMNEERRYTAQQKQLPLSADEQRRRANDNAEAHAARWPEPPQYRMSYAVDEPVQPQCYQQHTESTTFARGLRSIGDGNNRQSRRRNAKALRCMKRRSLAKAA